MIDPEYLLPTKSELESAVVDGAPTLNPFAGEATVEAEQRRLDLGGSGILHIAGVLTPPERQTDSGVETATYKAAKTASGLIARLLVVEGNPQTITFPACDDLRVIGEALKQFADTPLGIGYGAAPATVSRAWSRFMKETAANYRERNSLDQSELVPLTIELPAWLQENPAFDVLAECSLMDIEIVGVVNSVVASSVSNCRIRFRDTVMPNAVVGTEARRSTFIFDGDMRARASFNGATNTSIHIAGVHSGGMGPVATSRVTCAGIWEGNLTYRGSASTWSDNVRASSANSGY